MFHDIRRSALVCTETGQQAPGKFVVERSQKVTSVAGDVLVKVEAASVNPIDVRRSIGYGQRLLSLKGAGRAPLVLGNDFAGRVLTPDDRNGLAKGQLVFGLLPMNGRGGSHASIVAANPRWLRPAPDGIPAAELAALPYSFTTMYQSLRAVDLLEARCEGATVLVHGGSGALGMLATQYLSSYGARVIATSSKGRSGLCLGQGAVRWVDGHDSSGLSSVGSVDAILNFASFEDEHALLALLGNRARGYATAVHPLMQNFDRHGWLSGAVRTFRDRARGKKLCRARAPEASYEWIVFRPEREALDVLLSLVHSGGIRLPVGLVASLDNADEAFGHVKRRAEGRAILRP
ncbi:alcohol dehydrogenase catalytic domain-containing protein [Roseateles chitinivorans]|uniref:alcohol dehydrogenase catalytic domain-containing protein n=1 Tax=Roseateles chitinivorans TaxID=2917965 RepID=UPI003D67CFF5